MHILASELIGKGILSIRNGHPVAMISGFLINPDKLEVAALYCQDGGRGKNQSVLLMRDIRDYVADGAIIDSLEDIEDASEIVRLRDLVEQKYSLVGAGVSTESGQKLGNVEDFTIETTSSAIQKLYIKQSILRNLLHNSLVVDRTQIVDVTPKHIIVRDTTTATSELAAAKSPLAPTPTEAT
jgi:sporulation protein YlmC with PRC-barrel domain